METPSDNSDNNLINADERDTGTNFISQVLSSKGVYILYLASLLTGITALIGLVVAYALRGQAPEWEQSHYQFLIRTFWIGLLYSVIGILLTVILIGFLILLFVAIWLIVRCIQGLQLAARREPVPNPRTWLFN